MANTDAEALDRKIDQFSDKLPPRAARFLGWLRDPSSRWVRIPVAVLLICGGMVGFLPVLGFWMIPLGAILLAQDLPFLQKPLLRSLTWLEDKWTTWKRRRSRATAAPPLRFIGRASPVTDPRLDELNRQIAATQARLTRLGSLMQRQRRLGTPTHETEALIAREEDSLGSLQAKRRLIASD